MNDMPWIKSYSPGVSWDAEIPIMPVQQILERNGVLISEPLGIGPFGEDAPKLTHPRMDAIKPRDGDEFTSIGRAPLRSWLGSAALLAN